MIKRVTPIEAKDLLEKEGYVYLDVRSIPEYEQGHVPGAYNIPLLHLHAGQMLPNSQFLEVVKKTFSPDTKIVVGCKSGGRSLRAAEQLLGHGYLHVVDMRGGMGGEFDMLGQVQAKGWVACSLPISTQAEPGKTYEELGSR